LRSAASSPCPPERRPRPRPCCPFAICACAPKSLSGRRPRASIAAVLLQPCASPSAAAPFSSTFSASPRISASRLGLHRHLQRAPACASPHRLCAGPCPRSRARSSNRRQGRIRLTPFGRSSTPSIRLLVSPRTSRFSSPSVSRFLSSRRR
jgi:hypothetical protein